MVGTGGAAALWLAARRQRTSEIALRQKELDHAKVDRAYQLQERTAAASDADATERRVTELCTEAADQLGSDKAPVRLAGMYALERLGQSTPDQRQTIANLLCAYLRMPFDALRAEPDESWSQERQVRLTAQRIVAKHLREGDDRWPDLDIDLTGATLIEADFSRCQIRSLRCTEAVFSGPASFTGARFTTAVFNEAQFTGWAGFQQVEFAGWTTFRKASFADSASFPMASFHAETSFNGTRFAHQAEFNRATFAGTATFEDTAFSGDALFTGTRFTVAASFDRALFRGAAAFRETLFEDGIRFNKAVFETFAEFDWSEFHQYVDFSLTEFKGDTRFSHVRLYDSVRFARTKFLGDAQFTDALVKLDVPDTVARAWPDIDRAQPGRFVVEPSTDPEWGQLRYRRDDESA